MAKFLTAFLFVGLFAALVIDRGFWSALNVYAFTGMLSISLYWFLKFSHSKKA